MKEFHPGKLRVPACTFMLEWMSEGQQQQLFHKVAIKGAKEPDNVLAMRYYPETAGMCVCVCVLCV